MRAYVIHEAGGPEAHISEGGICCCTGELGGQ